MSISKNCKKNVETLPIVSKSREKRRAIVEAPNAHGHSFSVNATKVPRRRFLHLAAGTAALPATTRLSWAQAYPTRPITMIVPFAAGAGADVMGRIMAARMRTALGQPIIVENVGGAEGSLGVGRVARARPDGYTIDLGSMGNHVLNGALISLQYDVLHDFAPISPLATNSFVLFARNNFPANDLRELMEWLKANPNTASAGIPNVDARLLTTFFQNETGTRLALVPYRGGAPAFQDLVAGQIDLLFGLPFQLPLVRAGTIKAFATTSEARLALAPDIPTFAELGAPTLSYSFWFGLFAPKNTPKDIIVKLNAAVVETLADPAVRQRLIELGLDGFPGERQTPEALGALVQADAEKWWPIIREFGIKAE